MLNAPKIELTSETKARLRQAARQVITTIVPRYRASFQVGDRDGNSVGMVAQMPAVLSFDSYGCYLGR